MGRGGVRIEISGRPCSSGRQASDTSISPSCRVLRTRTIRALSAYTRAQVLSATTRASRSLFRAMGILAGAGTAAVMQLV